MYTEGDMGFVAAILKKRSRIFTCEEVSKLENK